MDQSNYPKVTITRIGVPSGNPLILDDINYGYLDTAGISLSGDVTTDVTQYVHSVSIKRGKSNELDRYQAGNASVEFVNHQRVFDPVYGTGIEPKSRISIANTGGEVLFVGWIDDWNLDYAVNGDSIASCTCSDGFSLLSQQYLAATSWSSELPGLRVAKVLGADTVQWALADTAIADGNKTLVADTITANTNALEYLQLIETTDRGRLFMSRDGKLTFESSNTTGWTTGSVPPTISDDGLSFTGSGSGIPFQEIGVNYGSELLYNTITASSYSASTATVIDTLSVSKFGIAAQSFDGVLTNSTSDLVDFAWSYANTYAEPTLRFNSVKLALHNTSVPTSVLTYDIGDLIYIRFTPNKIGSPLIKLCRINGLSWEFVNRNGFLTIDLNTEINFPLILDDQYVGLLDYNGLAY